MTRGSKDSRATYGRGRSRIAGQARHRTTSSPGQSSPRSG
jgi:hypothetical protein